MEENKPIPAETRPNTPELPASPRGITPQSAAPRPGPNSQSAPLATGPKQLKIMVHLAPPESPAAETGQLPASDSQIPNQQSKIENEQIPARMLNEFVYCQRLFYYEFVEGVFVESADTLRGGAIHQRVDSGNGALPAAKKKAESREDDDRESRQQRPLTPQAKRQKHKTRNPKRFIRVLSRWDRSGWALWRRWIWSRCEPHGPSRDRRSEDLFTALEVCPVDYKAGAPKEGEEANELWDTDKMQLGLQALILRDNGYTCNEGVIYYRATKQRVRLPITPELENWILQNIAEAKRVIAGPIPAPLVHSPKCVRCSLAPVCLPDETRMLAQSP